MTDLLEAVDLVTKPVVSKILREDGTLHTVRLPSLLEQIEAAVTSSGKDSAGGGGSTVTGSVLNSAAFDEMIYIRRTITHWRSDVGLKRVPDLAHALRDWYMVFIRTGGGHESFIQEIKTWAHKIKLTLDPPRRFELIGPCVECHAATFHTVEGDEAKNPVLVEAPNDLTGLDEARAQCRACLHEWRGGLELRALSFEMGE